MSGRNTTEEGRWRGEVRTVTGKGGRVAGRGKELRLKKEGIEVRREGYYTHSFPQLHTEGFEVRLRRRDMKIGLETFLLARGGLHK